MAGICGGFTTFSAFSLQTLDLLRSGATVRAATNILVSVSLCVAAVAAGHLIAASLNEGAVKIAQITVEEEVQRQGISLTKPRRMRPASAGP